MNEFQKIMLAMLSKQYGMSEDEVAELLFPKSEDDDSKFNYEAVNENLLDTLLGRDKDRVTSLKSGKADKTKIYDEAFADAKKQILPKVEKKLAEDHGLEYSKGMKLDDIVTAIVTKTKAEVDPEGKGLTDDAVRKHKLYLDLENKAKDDKAKLKEEHQAAIDKIEKAHEREGVIGTVKNKALEVLDSMNPVLGKNATVALNRRTDFANQFEAHDYELVKDDLGKVSQILVLDAEGKRKEDGHGNALAFDEFVKTLATPRFEFAVQDPKQPSGNEDDAGGGGGGAPTSRDEYNKKIFAANTPEERTQIREAYIAAGGDPDATE